MPQIPDQAAANRLKEARKSARYRSAADAAKAMGTPGPTYQAHENGNRGFTDDAERYARFFKVSLEWLLTGRGEMKPTVAGDEARAFLQNPRLEAIPLLPAETADFNIQSLPKDLPVMGNASCGDDGLFEFNGEVLDFVRRPPRLINVKGAYALWIDGASMAPWREHGGLIVVHPHQPIRINDYVVVQLKPKTENDPRQRAYIKRLVRRTGTSLVLHQYNPDKDLSIPLTKVASIHRILDWDEAMGF